MTRLLVFVVILYLVWRGLGIYGRRKLRQAMGAEDFSRFSARRRDRSQRASPESAEELVACSGCGTYIPRERALGTGARQYCSVECRKRHELDGGSRSS